ncbi:hypothetical protein T06_5159 [Trichinella sp. T6]|nr:hypothetical protein T06_5159 [Trichinella sp. T6]
MDITKHIYLKMEREFTESYGSLSAHSCDHYYLMIRMTILYYVKARVNSGRLIFIDDETRSENMLRPSHFLMENYGNEREKEFCTVDMMETETGRRHIFQCLLDLEIVCTFTNANQDIMEKNIEDGMNHISDEQCFT